MIARNATGAFVPSVPPAVRLAVSSALCSIARPGTSDIDIRYWGDRIVEIFENFSHIDSPINQPLSIQRRRALLAKAKRHATKLQEALAEGGEEFLPLFDTVRKFCDGAESELARLRLKATKPGKKRSLLAGEIANVGSNAYEALSGKRASYHNNAYQNGAVRGQYPVFLRKLFKAFGMTDSAGNRAKATARRMRKSAPPG